MTDPALLPAAAFVVAAPLLLGAAVRDLAVRIIPNEIALGVALVGGLARVADGRLASAVIASAGVFVVTLLLWCRGWLGGGDVKLLAASVLLVSPAHVPGMLLTTAMAGSVLAL
ncbi:MAG: prepilin peptidase, partial [Rhodospirillales bacterium]|nr:prepilin peptidase [Rhodospirillales bacterium]